MLALLMAIALALAWIPALLKFFRAWRLRTNPISLAICLLIAFVGYLPVFVTATAMLSSPWDVATVLGVDAVICASFMGAILWANRKFSGERGSK